MNRNNSPNWSNHFCHSKAITTTTDAGTGARTPRALCTTIGLVGTANR